MITLRSADLQELASDDVLLIDTADDLTYKLVILEEKPLGLSVAEVSSDTKDGDMDNLKELGKFYCSTIRIGKPISFMGIPKTEADNVVKLGSRTESKAVVKIELYESGKEKA